MILYFLFYIIAFSLYIDDLKSFFKLSLISHSVFIMFLFEHNFGLVTYYISDGLNYISNPEVWISDKSRATWGYINYFEKYYDILGTKFAKILNIPLLLIFNKQFQNLFKVYLGKINIVILLPYFFFMSISNLRDILILIAILSCTTFFHKKQLKYYSISLLFFLMLFSLRPFIALLLLIIFTQYFIPTLKTKLQLIRYILVSIFSIFIFIQIFSINIDKYLYNLNYYLNEGLNDRIEFRQAELLGSPDSPIFWIKAHLRYIFAPFPHSIISSFSDPKSFVYGSTSKVLRLINQLIYFGFLTYISLNLNKVYSVFKSLNASAKSFLLILASHLPIYSILHFGGVHQRTKLPFQIFIIVIGLLIWRLKKIKNVKTK